MNTYSSIFGKRRNYVKYGDDTLINYGDFHTHTIYSLHGMSSPSEMVDAAIEAGLDYIALTDHHVRYSDDPDNKSDFINRKNQIARAYEINRSFAELDERGIIKVIPGYEYNLYTSENSSSFVTDEIPHLRSIGYHTWYGNLKYTSIDNYLKEIEERLSTKMYKIFVHPERDIDDLGKIIFRNCKIICGNLHGDIEDNDNLLYLMDNICNICSRYRVVIECNNSSLSNPLNSEEKKKKIIARMKCWIRKAQLYGLNIVVNSDAHVKYGVGRCDEAFELLNSMGIDKKRIVNFDKDMIEELLVP